MQPGVRETTCNNEENFNGLLFDCKVNNTAGRMSPLRFCHIITPQAMKLWDSAINIPGVTIFCRTVINYPGTWTNLYLISTAHDFYEKWTPTFDSVCAWNLVLVISLPQFKSCLNKVYMSVYFLCHFKVCKNNLFQYEDYSPEVLSLGISINPGLN